MNVIKDADVVKFTNFSNETSIIYFILRQYFDEHDVHYILSSNTITISTYDYNEINTTLIKQISLLNE